MAGSRLAHYAGGATLNFRYHDHNTSEQAAETLTQRDIVARLKQHIPEKFFRMVRYFGFLANRVCGEKLPVVYSALGMDKPEPVPKVCYAQMSKQFLRRDPFECVLCGGQMVYQPCGGWPECAGAENPRAGDLSDEVHPGLMQGRSASRLQKARKTT